MWILYFLPKKILSHLVGKLMHAQLPKSIARYSVRTFARIYNINVDEAEKPLDQYLSIGDFFTRKLKAGVRPLAYNPLVHPADSVIAQIGEIENGMCIQAKDKFYSVGDLVNNGNVGEKFKQGLFVTYYLCPTDYHRVHSPIDGEITQVSYIPGNLWPVNNWSANNIDNLFAVNERVVLHIRSRVANCMLVFVGATNVGQIKLQFEPKIISNSEFSPEPMTIIYDKPIPISRGLELGLFSMGSTVVMIYPKTIRLQRDDWKKFLNKPVKVGEGFL